MGLFLCSDFFFFFAVCIKVVNSVVAFALLFYDFFSPFLSVNSGMKETHCCTHDLTAFFSPNTHAAECPMQMYKRPLTTYDLVLNKEISS